MTDTNARDSGRDETAVDDVRRVRERLEQESGGDIQKHIQESNHVLEQFREKLGLKLVPPPARQPRRDRASG